MSVADYFLPRISCQTQGSFSFYISTFNIQFYISAAQTEVSNPYTCNLTMIFPKVLNLNYLE